MSVTSYIVLTRYSACLTIDFFLCSYFSIFIILLLNDPIRNCVEVTILPSNGDLFELEDEIDDSLGDGGDNADTPLEGAIHNAGAVAGAIQDAMGSEESDSSQNHCRTDTNTCGPGIDCDYGSCCSQWGWCGWSAAPCGECCQSNCWSS